MQKPFKTSVVGFINNHGEHEIEFPFNLGNLNDTMGYVLETLLKDIDIDVKFKNGTFIFSPSSGYEKQFEMLNKEFWYRKVVEYFESMSVEEETMFGGPGWWVCAYKEGDEEKVREFIV